MAMKTTLNLDDELLRRAKRLAAERGVTLTSIFEEALRRLVDAKPKAGGFRLRWTVVKDAAPPAVDPADRDALYEVMEGRR